MDSHDRGGRFRTPSDIEIRAVYEPEDTGRDSAADIGEPGAFPFTRGVYPDMYRGRRWTMRQYAGFGTAVETNQRFRFLLEQGQTGLSVAFDLPTQMGIDSDDPLAAGEVGRVGVAVDTLDDMEVLFDQIPLDRVSTSMTINATAAILLAMYVAVADRRGIARERLSGTIQNDILKEFIARGTYIYPVEPSLRLVTDIFDFCSRDLPRWNSISISGYHMREAGSTADQEIAFTLGNAREYVRRALDRGLELEQFAPRLSFFFAAHNDLFEEVAKFRAARRLWARLIREEFGGSDRSGRLRFHTQTGGSTLTAQQPLNNVVRVAIQAMSAVLGGTQSLHTNGYDEALALPGVDAARLALRTQQVIAEESGIGSTVDALAGSWYVEWLTDELERRAVRYLERLDELASVAEAISFMSEEIHRAAYRWQLELERGDRQVVGVNCYEEEEAPLVLPQPDFGALGREQARRLAAVRANRDDSKVRKALADVGRVADSDGNLVPAIIEAVKVRGTLGEISSVMKDLWGPYQGA